MAQTITPKRRVELALQKKFVDKVPFTSFISFWLAPSIENPAIPQMKWVPQSTVERDLRNRGLCLVDILTMGYGTARPNVKVVSTVYDKNGRMFIRTDYETPVGKLYNLKEVGLATIWWHKKLFSSPDDYKTLLFLIKDTKVFPDYDTAEHAIKTYGEDWILRCDLGFEPLQDLISGDYMTTTEFCIQWMDNRDELLKLYDALVEVRRQTYKVVADSPLYYIMYGGNVHPKIVSPENFKKYYVPHYEEAAEVLHKKGKVLGCHFDADTKAYKDIIADTSLDIIEAFTPAPDTDMTMKEAREVWPNKIIWINFPSSLHLTSKEKIEQTTEQIIDDGGPELLLIGITEDVPEFRWQESYTAIMDAIDRKFNIKISLVSNYQ
jgi:hypothetical protein